MSFTSPVINCIHPVTKGFGCTLDRKDFTERGIFTVTTQSFNETTTVPQSFMVDDRPVSVNFSISSRLNIKIKLDEPPLILESATLFSDCGPLQNNFYSIFAIEKTFISLKLRYIHLRIREDTRNLQQCTCLMRTVMMNQLH